MKAYVIEVDGIFAAVHADGLRYPRDEPDVLRQKAQVAAEMMSRLMRGSAVAIHEAELTITTLNVDLYSAPSGDEEAS